MLRRALPLSLTLSHSLFLLCIFDPRNITDSEHLWPARTSASPSLKVSPGMTPNVALKTTGGQDQTERTSQLCPFRLVRFCAPHKWNHEIAEIKGTPPKPKQIRKGFLEGTGSHSAANKQKPVRTHPKTDGPKVYANIRTQNRSMNEPELHQEITWPICDDLLPGTSWLLCLLLLVLAWCTAASWAAPQPI